MRMLGGPRFKILREHRGQPQAGEVIELVGQKIKDKPDAYERQPQPSIPRLVRSWARVRWCRLDLKEEGLIGLAARDVGCCRL